MARLPDDGKLTARVPPEVRERFDVMLARFQREGRRYRGRRIGIEGVVAALVLEFLGLDEARQADWLDRRLPEMEGMWAEWTRAQEAEAEAEGAEDGSPGP